MTRNGPIRPATPAAVADNSRSLFRDTPFPGFLLALSGLLLLLWFVLPSPVRGGGAPAGIDDRDGNGCEDLLDDWLSGQLAWESLRDVASPQRVADRSAGDGWPEAAKQPESTVWSRGNLRLLCLGATAGSMEEARLAAADVGGVCRVLQDISHFGGVAVYEVDRDGLAAFLPAVRAGFVMLDRDGIPALDRGRQLIGAEAVWQGEREVRGDWGVSVAILDSGCDTAHGDLGDYSQDDIDGPPPQVGHSLDWFPAEQGWTAFGSYKVVGWQDVTSNFPEAAGPWDYHHHGTAMAGIVAGSGTVDGLYSGVAPTGRLTIVKFYEFDGIWRQWAGDFLAACAWTIDNAELCRIRVALAAVNWEVDAGISAAVDAMSSAGILPVVAAGNDGLAGPGLGYPALCPAAVTVGAVNDEGALAAYSSRAPAGVLKPDVLAPGGGLLAENGRIMTTDNEPNDSYSERSGTSLAAAHVAGAAALVLDGWRQAAISLPDPSHGGRLLGGLLCATAAPVTLKENSDGSGTTGLVGMTPPGTDIGWGLVHVPAAIDALLAPLEIGASISDTLGIMGQQTVVARRLALLPDTEFIVELQPEAGLDVDLEVVDVGAIVDPLLGHGSRWADFGGPGQGESVRGLLRVGDVAVVVVRRISGHGSFTLTVSRVPGSEDLSFSRDLGGSLTGWLNVGRFAGDDDPTLVAVAALDIDPFAWRLHAIAADGQPRSGWPVTYFVNDSQATMTAPLIWDLDGDDGDEVVVASSFGRVYYVSDSGGLFGRDITGVGQYALTVPVGIETSDAERLIATVDENGVLYRMNSGGTVVGTTPLDGSLPLAPAVGDMVGDEGDEITVLLGSGSLTMCDAGGAVLAGWPVDMEDETAGASFRDPVLVDWQNDGVLEIVVPVVQDDGSGIELRIFSADGSVAPDDGVSLVVEDGGHWVSVSAPAIGRQGDRTQEVLLSAVAATGDGEGRNWSLREIAVEGGGGSRISPVTGIGISATIASSTLEVLSENLLPPFVHDCRGGGDWEREFLMSLDWQEAIVGIGNRIGAAGGWYRPDPSPDDLCNMSPVFGPAGLRPLSPGIGGAVIATGPGRWSRVSARGRRLISQAGSGPVAATIPWGVQRGDGRNSGSAPAMDPIPTAVGDTPWAAGSLRLWPNPSAGGVQVDLGDSKYQTTSLDIFDVRGRRVRHFDVGDLSGKSTVFWDTRDGRGRSVAAGSYFFVAEPGGVTRNGRVTVTR